MKKIFLLYILISCHLHVFSQNDIEDGKNMIKGYVSPLVNSFGNALNNGWYNTAKPHKLGGFDITITASVVLVPEEKKIFNISDYGGETFSNNGINTTPSILGDGTGAEIIYHSPTGDEKFLMLDGLDISFVPLPMLQAGLGLIKGTELNVRYIPEREIGNAGNIALFGLGIKHDILQWIPIAKNTRIELSIQTGYTKLSSEIKLSESNQNEEAITNLEVSAMTINILL